MKQRLLIWLLLAPLSSVGQTTDTLQRTPQLDASDLAKRWFGIKLVPGNDSTLSKPQWAVLPSLNYQPATGVAVGGILTTSFYPAQTPRTRLSTAHLYAGYSQFNQVLVTAISNLWTRGHRFNIQGDWRFYNFPTTTYGLGNQTQLADASDLDYNHIRFYQMAYRAIARDYMIGVGYLLDYHFDIQNTSLNGQLTDYDRYGRQVRSTSSGLAVGVLRDRRDNLNNPTGGSYFLAQYRHYDTWLGSNVDYDAIWLDYRRYVPLGGRLEKQLAFWGFNWTTFGNGVPYLDLPSTGWDTYNNSGRGYAMGRFRGPALVYVEAEYRTELTANGLLGAVLFANAQTVHNWLGDPLKTTQETAALHTTKIWPGVGGGLRVKVNKNARTNLAIDYGFGAGGSHGLYFNLNEVF
ncbi:hypothetical protein FAES_1871 [Fibrella aestuarina BUZ 2]|uniref:Bacterial surface antigen (D15) domain-containing protein n=1 Tax=Fibrella aestuarina BUZ 2 TaxID=1166018 RepID=I0K6X7_9BACT|nr:BamA/TamA family outer membrane protein [Fibrella aestuarina]CCG99880.1 hypothetical protein FAES_1871 [Fibrella aestuarina BUZ 2]